MTVRVTVSFAAVALPGGGGTLAVSWAGVGQRQRLALLIVAGTDRGFAVSDAAARIGGGVLGVVGLDGERGSAEVAVDTPIGPAPRGSELTLLLCDDAMPVDRAGIDTNPVASGHAIELRVPDERRSGRVDGVLLVCRSPGAVSPAYDLVLAMPGTPVMSRFVHLGVLRYRAAETDPGVGRPLGEILDDYGAANSRISSEQQHQQRGNELWEMLPDEFRRRYWQEVDLRRLFTPAPAEAPRVLIASDDWSFPWEVVAPLAPGDAAVPTEELGLLGKRAAISRWPLGDEPPARIAIDGVMAWYSDIRGMGVPAGQLESGHVEAFAGRLGGGVPFVPRAGQQEPAVIVDYLRESRRGAAHLRTHGSPRMIYTKGDHAGLSPADLRDIANGDPRDPPFPRFLFVNACSTSGNGGAEAISPGAGFAEALVNGGCHGVVLTHWAINVTHCIRAAKAFYDELERDASPAEAMRRVRQRALELGEPPRSSTLLAYLVVGHPSAQVVAT